MKSGIGGHDSQFHIMALLTFLVHRPWIMLVRETFMVRLCKPFTHITWVNFSKSKWEHVNVCNDYDLGYVFMR